MSKFEARKPDYHVLAQTRRDAPKHKGRVGSAWKNPNGTISISLHPFVALSAIEDLQITLFPADEQEQS